MNREYKRELMVDVVEEDEEELMKDPFNEEKKAIQDSLDDEKIGFKRRK